MPLGFSTGAIFRKIPSISKKIINVCREIGCNAIELSAMTANEVEFFDNLIKSSERLSDFKYISMHSPGIGVIYKKDTRTREILNKLEKAYVHFDCSSLVVHPALVEDWSVFDDFSFNLAIENMSKDVPFYLPEQLKEIFKKDKNYSMTLDVKHAFESNSGRKDLPAELYEAFEDKIVEIHLSGYNPNAKKHEHKPLIVTNHPEIVNFVKDKQHIPIIIESDCEDVEQMKAEFEYIKKILVLS